MNALTNVTVSGKLRTQFKEAEEIATSYTLTEKEKLVYGISIIHAAMSETDKRTKNYAALQTSLIEAEKQLAILSKKDSYFKKTLAELTQRPITLSISKLLKAFAQWTNELPKKNQILSK